MPKRKRYNDPPVVKTLVQEGKFAAFYAGRSRDYQQLAWRIGSSPYVACVLDNLTDAVKTGDIELTDALAEALDDFVSVSEDDNGEQSIIFKFDVLATIEDWRFDQMMNADAV